MEMLVAFEASTSISNMMVRHALLLVDAFTSTSSQQQPATYKNIFEN